MNSEQIMNKENDNNNQDSLLYSNLEIKKEGNEQNEQNINNNGKSQENILEEEKRKKIPDPNFLNDFYKNEDLKIKDKKSKDGKSIIDINDLLGKKEDEIPITLEILEELFENFSKSKISSRNFGIIKAYGVNTSQGIIRDYNEDRVSIVINMVKPPNIQIDDLDWPKISYFGIFDGHAGNTCADYLKDNLIKKISNNIFFPKDIKNAIKFGFQSAEKEFLENYAVKNNKIIDKSGSCALILLTINNLLYVANVGDSRCLISCKKGKILKDVTRDHKPNYPYEKERIIKNQGNIYQSETPIDIDINDEEDKIFLDKVILGPYRVSPGRLSVSRTIGDAEAKLPKFGGNPNVIISEPDIYIFDLEKDDVDFFILGCDGIYDQLSSKEVLDCAWMVFNDLSNQYNSNLNISCGNIVDMILKMSMIRKSYDNVTCLIVALKDIKNEKVSVHKNEIKALFSKINNKKINLKLNENQERSSLMNKNRLPSLHLHMNQKKYNKFGLKKLFKNSNNFLNYINKINININKPKKKEENYTIRNISVPRQKNRNLLIRNTININKNTFLKDRFNNDYSQLLLNSNNNKKIYASPKFDLNNLTEPNKTDKYKNRVNDKAKSILINSEKRKNLKSLNVQKNSSYSINDEEYNNSLTILQKKKSMKENRITPTSLRINRENKNIINDYSIEDKKYLKFFSVNKKNSLLIDSNYNNSEKKINEKNKVCNIRLKSVENKIPLYQKALIKTNIVNRNGNEDFSLKNNKINIMTYDNKSNNIKKDHKYNILNNYNNFPLIDESNNNIKFVKPIKLKIELLNSNNQSNKEHSNSNTKYNSPENSLSENKMPFINQKRRIITNLINN